MTAMFDIQHYSPNTLALCATAESGLWHQLVLAEDWTDASLRLFGAELQDFAATWDDPDAEQHFEVLEWSQRRWIGNRARGVPTEERKEFFDSLTRIGKLLAKGLYSSRLGRILAAMHTG